MGDFARAAETYLEAVESALSIDGSASHAEWDALTPRLNFDTVRNAHQALSERDRGEALVVWKSVKEAGELLTELLKHKRQTDDGSGFAWPLSKLDRGKAVSTHSAAVKAVSVFTNDLKVIR